jgi:soluble lytic murein transglycosylase-like protein
MALAAARTSSAFCFEEAGAKYNISPTLLMAIAKVESEFDPQAYNKNAKGLGYDYGVMQINSWWASKIGRKHWNELDDACKNVHVGAWILSQCFEAHGYTWEAVGYYNARTKHKRDKYVQKIQKAVQQVTGYGGTLPVRAAKPRNGKMPVSLAKHYAHRPAGNSSPGIKGSRIIVVSEEEIAEEFPTAKTEGNVKNTETSGTSLQDNLADAGII